jgi:hypothetical protein
MPQILNKRERVILSIAGCVLICGIIFNFFIFPVIRKNAALNKEIYVTKERLKKYMLLLKQKDYIQEKYNSLSSGQVLPKDTKDPLVSALSEIEAIAKQANVRILDIRPAELKKQKDISIDFKAEATLEDYLKFIYNTESSLSLLRIKKFQLNAKPNTLALEGSFSLIKIQLSE